MKHALDFTRGELADRLRALPAGERRMLAARAAAEAARDCGIEVPADAAALVELLGRLEAEMDELEARDPVDVRVVEGRLIASEPAGWRRAARAAAAVRAHWCLLDPDDETAALGAVEQALGAVADPEALARRLA
jgi:hypothetical protein